MSHGPATEWGEDKASGYKEKLGIYLFLLYFVVYAIFVALNVLSPKSMGMIVFANQNLALLYGFGLIILAIVMGLIYNHLCTRKENELNVKAEDQK